MNKRRHVKNIIGAYIYGDLAPEEMRRVREHLDGCEPCREDAESQARAIACIPDQGRTLLEVDRQRVRWSVLGAVRRDSSEPVRRAAVWRLLRGFGMAGALACMFVGGLFVGAQQFKPSDEPKPVSNWVRPPYRPMPGPAATNGVNSPNSRRKPAGYTVLLPPGPVVRPPNDWKSARTPGKARKHAHGHRQFAPTAPPADRTVTPPPAPAPVRTSESKLTLTASAEWSSPVAEPVRAVVPISKDDARRIAPPVEGTR